MVVNEVFTERQLFGYLAFCATTYAFSQKSDKRMLWCHFIGACLWCIHSIVLMAWVGAATNLVLALRIMSSVLLRGWKGRKYYLSLGFVILNWLLAWWFWRSWFDILPVIATTLGTINTMHWNGIKMRLAMLASSLMWLLYSININSIGGIISGIVLSSMTIITVTRLYRDQQQDTKL